MMDFTNMPLARISNVDFLSDSLSIDWSTKETASGMIMTLRFSWDSYSSSCNCFRIVVLPEHGAPDSSTRYVRGCRMSDVVMPPPSTAPSPDSNKSDILQPTIVYCQNTLTAASVSSWICHPPWTGPHTPQPITQAQAYHHQ
mmetsp:Transcript_17531/g.35070  ORF Transcript_17531/g.35070 Transcript_17531/m.35070 type:complete len:142 (-) Transcript_17531:603-1028(-)